MHNFKHKIFKVCQELGDDFVCMRALLYPEINRLSDQCKSAQFDRRLIEISENTEIDSFSKRVLPSDPVTDSLSIELTPTKDVAAKRCWIKPAKFTMHYVAWQHSSELVRAWVPTLDLSIVKQGKVDAKFVGQIRSEIRSCLLRTQQLVELRKLVYLQNSGPFSIVESSYEVSLPSARDVAKEEPAENEKRELPEVASRLDKVNRASRKSKKSKRGAQTIPAFHIDDQIRQLAARLAEPDRQSVLLVGPSGVGKSKTVQALARRKRGFGFGPFEFWETSGSRIVAGMSGFGQWQDRCQKITEELKQRDGILHVGNLLELLETGKSSNQVQSIASWMQTQVQRGNLQIIAECTPEQLVIAETRDPQLLESLTVLRIDRPDSNLQKNIFGSVLDHLLENLPDSDSSDPAVTADPQAVDSVYWLHQRYATYSANPGRPIQFLQRLVEDAWHEVESSGDANRKVVLDAEFVARAFSARTGLPFFLLSRNEPLDLSATEDWFRQRVLGQPVPVQTVTNLIATIKSALSPPGKPIASLMFIGPTGVGKTEMAKSLAEFMFGSQQRLLRFDMSEFSDPVSVQRLIGGTGEKEGILTGKVKQHPFSVVLFDEFEKAHPAFFDLLLQVLGEGRLTDGQGRTTDFSTTIIVITSNLGAEQFKPVSFGFAGAENDADTKGQRYEDHFVTEVRNKLRPELFNRLDRIVPFRPLQMETVEQIVGREIEKLKKREGIWYRPVTLDVQPEVIQWLARSSMDLRYGARPIQRLIHDRLTVPLSESLANFTHEQSVAVAVTCDETDSARKIRIEAKGVEEGAAEIRSSRLLIDEIQQVRRRAQKLRDGDVMVGLRNEMFRLVQANQRDHRKFNKLLKKKHHDDSYLNSLQAAIREREPEIESHRFYIDMAASIFDRCSDFEEQMLLKYFAKQDVATGQARAEKNDLDAEVSEAIFKNFLFHSGAANRASVFIWSRHEDIRQQMVRAYIDFATSRNLRVTCYAVLRYDSSVEASRKQGTLGGVPDEDGDTEIVADLYRQPTNNPFSVSHAAPLGYALEFNGPAAFPMFGHEACRHQFREEKLRDALVEVTGEKVTRHQLSDLVTTLGPFDELSIKQRVYDFSRKVAVDAAFGHLRDVDFSSISKLVVGCVEKALEKHLDKFME
ncbi:AAA family ATPase [Mariniblastus fucicola]|uniref:ATP-dependent Clp protease ATP-binding subunit ClpC n=1 Tax=Mariniblastus fucicola TaxID=980251 RepID=A0A5B9PCP4_9BACT|nr:AAA family ATPase [Mariniblastus fucicola]QEG20871.1 ATP-dependent Clp protease ATP-binding subunit ClpC [Mariniblastus fucicola]